MMGIWRWQPGPFAVGPFREAQDPTPCPPPALKTGSNPNSNYRTRWIYVRSQAIRPRCPLTEMERLP